MLGRIRVGVTEDVFVIVLAGSLVDDEGHLPGSGTEEGLVGVEHGKVAGLGEELLPVEFDDELTLGFALVFSLQKILDVVHNRLVIVTIECRHLLLGLRGSPEP